jgi:hypothetical protein
MRRSYVASHGAFVHPDRKAVTSPERGSNLCRQTQAVSLARRWIEMDAAADTVLT